MIGKTTGPQTVYPILFALSLSHLFNDTLQALIPSIYPVLKDTFQLSFSQIGLITLVFQLTASLLQPMVGQYTDRHPKPFSLAIGMLFTLLGLFVIALAPRFTLLLVGVALVGMGSAVFHPEASRVARMASGGRHGMAQSLFQVGGNAGSALGPLLAALIIVPFGRSSVMWFGLIALCAIYILRKIGIWYRNNLAVLPQKKNLATSLHSAENAAQPAIAFTIIILLILIFSKYIYMVSLTSYYTFYLIDKFGVSVQASQLYLFIFLSAVAAGTFVGGPLGDRFGRKHVIWGSILGAAPFTLLLPHVSLLWTVALTILIGLILSSAFSAILVYAQELMPGKIGLISGLFFGFAFGVAGIGSAVLGKVADVTSIDYVFRVCAFLPLLGFVFRVSPTRKFTILRLLLEATSKFLLGENNIQSPTRKLAVLRFCYKLLPDFLLGGDNIIIAS